MGFGAGLLAGTRASNDWIDNYKSSKEEAITNQVFKAAADLKKDRVGTDAEGKQMQLEAMNFANMTGDEITNSLLAQITAAGGKVDDQTYRITYGLGNLFKEKKNQYQMHNAKLATQEMREQNLRNTMFVRSAGNARNAEKHSAQMGGTWRPGGKQTITGSVPFQRDENGKIDPNTVDTTSKWFRNLTKEQKITILDEQGIAPTWTPRRSGTTVKNEFADAPPGEEAQGDEKSKCADGKMWSEKYQKCL